MQEKYYQEFLYPLQNKILKIIGNLEVEFYLTGGTALGRCYLFHRYSDDLDFFVNNSGNYKKNVETVINSLKKEVNLSIGIRAESFCRIIVSYNNTELKLDFVNDIETHFGDFHATEIFHKVDNPLNILSNKISALPRLEEKDIADILFLSRKYFFCWKTVINQAQDKDIWVEPIEVSKIINEFPVSYLTKIMWINKIDTEKAEKDLQTIAKDILLGSDNSLFEK